MRPLKAMSNVHEGLEERLCLGTWTVTGTWGLEMEKREKTGSDQAWGVPSH